jgi:hypothetical protein
VNIPEGCDPYSLVEVAVETEDYGQLTFEVHKLDPEQYHGLKGRNLTVIGDYNPNCPAVLRRPSIRGIDGKENRDTFYSVETRTLQGTIYDVTRPKGPHRLDTVSLVLQDETYFTMVQCLFLAKEEQDQITGPSGSAQHFQFGDRISIRGQVTLKNGLPVVLVGPNSINKLAPEPNP